MKEKRRNERNDKDSERSDEINIDLKIVEDNNPLIKNSWKYIL